MNSIDIPLELRALGDAAGMITGGSTAGVAAHYRSALATLNVVLAPLRFGEQPAYAELDRNSVEVFADDVQDILRWMAASDNADVVSAALGVMGHLSWESFVPFLVARVDSSARWQRLSAIDALNRIDCKDSAASLCRLVDDPDLEVRAAIRTALAKRRGQNG